LQHQGRTCNETERLTWDLPPMWRRPPRPSRRSEARRNSTTHRSASERRCPIFAAFFAARVGTPEKIPTSRKQREKWGARGCHFLPERGIKPSWRTQEVNRGCPAVTSSCPKAKLVSQSGSFAGRDLGPFICSYCHSSILSSFRRSHLAAEPAFFIGPCGPGPDTDPNGDASRCGFTRRRSSRTAAARKREHSRDS
jgi:hypothetical protein